MIYKDLHFLLLIFEILIFTGDKCKQTRKQYQESGIVPKLPSSYEQKSCFIHPIYDLQLFGNIYVPTVQCILKSQYSLVMYCSVVRCPTHL